MFATNTPPLTAVLMRTLTNLPSSLLWICTSALSVLVRSSAVRNIWVCVIVSSTRRCSREWKTFFSHEKLFDIDLVRRKNSVRGENYVETWLEFDSSSLRLEAGWREEKKSLKINLFGLALDSEVMKTVDLKLCNKTWEFCLSDNKKSPTDRWELWENAK